MVILHYIPTWECTFSAIKQLILIIRVEDVAPWLTRYVGEADMPGLGKTHLSRHRSGACRSVRQCQPCREALLCSALFISI